MIQEPSARMVAAWVRLENHLRKALPACVVSPPTQPSELLSALRISHAIDAEGEERIRTLRDLRNRAAHGIDHLTEEDAEAFEAEVASLLDSLPPPTAESC